jgi:hypothetical protein
VAQEVGNMRLTKSGLPRQQRNAQCSTLDSAQQFESNPILQLRKVHVENSLAAMRRVSRAFLAEILDRTETRHSSRSSFSFSQKRPIRAATH